MSSYVMINSMSCSCRNRCFYQALNYDVCQHAECESSTNSVRQLCQIQNEAEHGTDGEMHKCCKECVDKKCNIGTVIYLEVTGFSDVTTDNVAIANERHGMFHDNYNEGNTSITN